MSAESPNENKLSHRWRGRTTNNVTGDRVICGDWSKVIIATWDLGTVSILADPYSRAKDGLVEYIATLLADVNLAHAAAMVVSTDSGAQ
jgi:hypothetical protein